MTIQFRHAVAATAVVAVGLVVGGARLGAQEPGSTKPAEPVAKKKYDSARRVPDYFGQIGLTAEQRASIYGIQSKRYEKIEALEQQISAEKAAMLADCEATLTEVQKKLLDNLRHAASEPAPARTKTADTSKTAK